MKFAVNYKEIVSARNPAHAKRLAASRLEAMPASELEEWTWSVEPLTAHEQNWPTSQRVRNKLARDHVKQFGQSLVEFSLILPVMILLILGGVDIGRAYYTETQIVNAAREGARVASVTPAQPCAAATHAKTEAAGLVKASDLTVVVTEWTGPNGTGTGSVSTLTTKGACSNVVGANPQSVSVVITPTFVWVTPEMNVIFPKFKLPSVSSIMVVERWA